MHKFLYTFILLFFFLIFISRNSFADSLSTYTLVIEDSRNLLQTLSVELTDEEKYSQELQFEWQNQYWVAIAHLAEKTKYLYFVKAGEYEIIDSFKTGESRTIELFTYAPPKERCSVNLTVDDSLVKQYYNLFISINSDAFGKKNTQYCKPVAMEKKNGVFSKTLLLEKSQIFNLVVLDTDERKSDFVVYYNIITDKDRAIYHRISPIYQRENYSDTVSTVIKIIFPYILPILSSLLIYFIWDILHFFVWNPENHSTVVDSGIAEKAAAVFLILCILYHSVYMFCPAKNFFEISEFWWSMNIWMYAPEYLFWVYAGISAIVLLISSRFKPFQFRINTWLVTITAFLWFYSFKAIFHHGDCGIGEGTRQPLANYILKNLNNFFITVSSGDQFHAFSLSSVFIGILVSYMACIFIQSRLHSNVQRIAGLVLFFSGYGYMQLFCGHYETSGMTVLAVFVYAISAFRFINNKTSVFPVIGAFLIMCCTHVSTVCYFPSLLFLVFFLMKMNARKKVMILAVLIAAFLIVVHEYFYLIDKNFAGRLIENIFQSAHCVLFINPAAVILLFWLFIICRKKLTPVFKNRYIVFLFIGILSFVGAMTITNVIYTPRTFHTFAHIGILLFLVVLEFMSVYDISFSTIPIIFVFGVPSILMYSQHAGYYPYGKPQHSTFKAVFNDKYVANTEVSKKLGYLFPVKSFPAYRNRFILYLFSFGEKEIEGIPDYSLDIYDRMYIEYEAYRALSRYNPAPFIEALRSADLKQNFYALNLISQMNVYENNIISVVIPFAQSDDMNLKRMAETILNNASGASNDI